MSLYSRLVIFILVFLLAFISCEEEYFGPTIKYVKASKDTIWPLEEILLSSEYFAEDDAELTVVWTAQFGSFPKGLRGNSVTWKSPDQGGFFNIILSVSDGRMVVSDSVSVVIRNQAPGVLVDPRDGQEYPYQRIGNAVWMTKNMAFLPKVNRLNERATGQPKHYVHSYDGNDLDEATKLITYKRYGVLYNSRAAADACPEGWHLSTDHEWVELEIYLGMDFWDVVDGRIDEEDKIGKFLKSKDYWWEPGIGDNSTGFNALPGGFRHATNYYNGLEYAAYFWTGVYKNDSRWVHYLESDHDGVGRRYFSGDFGFSVRCVKNEE